MKAIDLYKFVTVKECNWYYTAKQNLVLSIKIEDLQEFIELLGYTYIEDQQVECILKNGQVWILMQDICDDFYIELTEIFLR